MPEPCEGKGDPGRVSVGEFCLVSVGIGCLDIVG